MHYSIRNLSGYDIFVHDDSPESIIYDVIKILEVGEVSLIQGGSNKMDDIMQVDADTYIFKCFGILRKIDW